MENIIEITLSEYRELSRSAERVEVFKRLLANNDYMTTKDIKAILDIEEVKEQKNETV